MGDSEFQKPISGSITAISQTIDLTSPNSSTEIVQITGTWVGTIVVEGSNNDADYYSIDCTDRSTKLLVNSISANGSFQANTNGWQFIRIRSIAWTSGTANISVYGSDAASLISTDSTIRGATDGSQIGNTGDKLRVESITSETQSDAFGRVRVSETNVIFNSSFVNSSEPLLYTTNLVGSGTVTRNVNTSSMDLVTTAASGDVALYQTKQYFRYVPGQSFLLNMSGKFGIGKSNVTQRFGHFDDNNGLFFELAGTDLRVVRRTKTSGSVVDSFTSQANWNLDPMDGTGPSGVTLDITKQQIFIIDFQWLGSGRIRFGFSISGNTVYVHQISTSNTLDVPWSQSGNLPLRCSVTNTGATSGSTTLRLTCLSAMVEGDNKSIISQHAISSSAGRSVNNSVFLPVMSLRLKSAFTRASLQIVNTPIISSTSDSLEVRILLNPTLTGSSFISAGINSIAEYDESATSLTGGELLGVFYVVQNSTNDSSTLAESLLKIVSDYAGTRDIATVAVKSLGNNATVRVAAVFQELF